VVNTAKHTLTIEGLGVAAPEWFEQIPLRHSRREYVVTPVGPDLLSALERCSAALSPISSGVRPVVVRRLKRDIFVGVVGSYGKVRGASSALILIGEKGLPGIEQRVGYVGEALILEATRLGLSTCWVGGFFSNARTMEHVELSQGERVYAVSPLGFTPETKSAEEKMMRNIARSHSRKPLEVIAPGLKADVWPAWALAGLEAASLAPSAMNRQPWRFRLDGEVVTAGVKRGIDTPKVSKWLDCGIAMLHFELGALGAGCPGAWELAGGRNEAVYRPA
jgi:hypothetical protein